MRALSAAIYAVLAGDATLATSLGTFDAKPSVFTKRPVPTEATRPIVLAATVVSDVEDDFLNNPGRVVTRDVAVYGNAATDFDKVDAAAERIRALFHRRTLTFAGFYSLPVIAAGPIDAPADPQEIGRIVTLSIRLREVRL